MALIPGSLDLPLRVNHALNKAAGWVSEHFSARDHTPEMALVGQPIRDPRLAPRVPMSNEHLDTGVLTTLSQIGMRRGKQVTDESHPELMMGVRLLAARAGFTKMPQVIIAENSSSNALVVTEDEVTLSTGLLRTFDLRDVFNVIGHELGHSSSPHTEKRLAASTMLGVTGAVLGNEFARAGGLGSPLSWLVKKWEPAKRLLDKVYGPNRPRRASTLPSLIYIGVGVTIGAILGNKFATTSTEFDADAKGAALSGDPEGMALMLRRLQQQMPPLSRRDKFRIWRSGHPDLGQRIERMEQMAVQQRAAGIVPRQHSVYAQVEAAFAASHQPATVPAQVLSPAPRIAVHDVTSAERVSSEVAAAALT